MNFNLFIIIKDWNEKYTPILFLDKVNLTNFGRGAPGRLIGKAGYDYDELCDWR